MPRHSLYGIRNLQCRVIQKFSHLWTKQNRLPTPLSVIFYAPFAVYAKLSTHFQQGGMAPTKKIIHKSSVSPVSRGDEKDVVSSTVFESKDDCEKQTTKETTIEAMDTPDKPRITIIYRDSILQRRPQTTCQYIINKADSETCGKPVKDSGMCGWHLNLSPDGIAWLVGPEGNPSSTKHMDASDWEWSETADRWVKKRYRISEVEDTGDSMDEEETVVVHESVDEDM
ncbi:hypothetical protein ACMFMF_000104 [Clarireedia jacksonii]